MKKFFVYSLSDLSARVEAQEYFYPSQNTPTQSWSSAETFCECIGTLARLDTQAEFNYFRTQM